MDALPVGSATPKETTNESREVISVRDQRDILDIYEKLREAEAKLISPDGKTEILPKNVYSFLCRLLAELKAGNSVTVLQSKAELTTVEASKLVGMSRQFLVGLLLKGEIPFHMVGTHRRLYARDVLAYKSKRDSSRRKTLDDLALAEHSEGIYDKIPDDFNPR
jgi:excisionase family DNA binding protein